MLCSHASGVLKPQIAPMPDIIAPVMPDSMRSGATAAVGSTRCQPRFGSQTSVQAWASDCLTIR